MGRLKKIIIVGAIPCLLMGGSTSISQDIAYKSVLKYLEGSIVPEAFITEAFNNERTFLHGEIEDRFNFAYEKKPYNEYRKIFITDKRIRGGKIFYKKNKALVDSVSTHFGINPFILVSIVGVESNYGTHHADYLVFNALYSIIHTMPKRQRWATKELGELLKISYGNNVEPHSVKGSYAGAFGFGQFIPSSFNHFAVDFDGDGIRSHLEWPDVLGSVANYLVKNGYKKGDSSYKKGSSVYKSIYAYNHSHNYVKAILELRERIEKSVEN